MELIKANDLSLAYDGRVVASGVDFSLSDGDYMCIVGENGSGKSTLMKAIIGEIQPHGGKITLSDELKKHGIGYLPQQSAIQRDFPASVREVVLSGAVRRDYKWLSWSPESKKKAADAMEMLGITHLAHRSFGELSGGQRQRVLLARAFCASEKLLLLDEPVTGLDPDAAHEMYDAVRKINSERGCAVIMVTHDVQCALKEASLVLSMCAGHSYFGSVDGYIAHEAADEAEDEKRHCHCHEHSHAHAHDEGGETV